MMKAILRRTALRRVSRIAVLCSAAILVASCAATRQLGSFGGSMPSATASTTVIESSSGSASPSPSLRAYKSPKWLYSVEYPAAWYQLPNSGAPDTDAYFSNETDLAPLMMDSNGVWLTIAIYDAGALCPARWVLNGADVTKTPLSVDGEATTMSASSNEVGVLVKHAGWCYSFFFITYSAQTLGQHRGEIDAMLKSFRFNR